MDIKLLLIITAVALIFALEGVFPHYRGRAGRVRHAAPHFITAIMNGLLTRFLLAGLTIAALAWAESKSLGLAHALSLPAAASLGLASGALEIWMYFWHLRDHH